MPKLLICLCLDLTAVFRQTKVNSSPATSTHGALYVLLISMWYLSLLNMPNQKHNGVVVFIVVDVVVVVVFVINVVIVFVIVVVVATPASVVVV